jgi:hypothetical protein
MHDHVSTVVSEVLLYCVCLVAANWGVASMKVVPVYGALRSRDQGRRTGLSVTSEQSMLSYLSHSSGM